jgi:sugar phosphate isomerase/epimerase
MPKRLSFQLYSARNFQPWEGVIEHVAKCGYKEVEGFGGAEYGAKGTVFDDVPKFRALLDKHGLAMPTSHLMPLALFETDMKRVLQIGKTMGIKSFYCPYIMPDDRKNTAAFWKGFGKRMGEIAKRVRGEGYGFGWHNHDFEFKKLPDGSFPIDRIFEGGPLVDFEMDIGWTIFAKQNPVKWIKTYGERITSVHVKDNAKPGQHEDEMKQSPVGSGTGNWPDIFKALRDYSRCVHYVVEHDNPKDFKSFAKTSFNYLSKI